MSGPQGHFPPANALDASGKSFQADDLSVEDSRASEATLTSDDKDPVESRRQRLLRHTDFAFIHSAENAAHGKSDADDLSTIRSHAMRNVRRERRIREEESKQLLPQAQSQTASPMTLASGEVQLGRNMSEELPRTESISDNFLSPEPPYANSPDPSYLSRYTTPSLTSRAESQDTILRSRTGVVLDELVPGFTQHLQYFVTDFWASVDPINAHLPVFCAQIAILEGHAALLHTICYVTAAHRALTRGIDIRMDWATVDDSDRSILESLAQHKDKALRFLKNGFSDLHKACTDTSILTVSLFLITESFFSDKNSIAVHVKGLGQMIDQRGGHEAIPPEIYAYIVMADVKTSILSLSTPSFYLTQRLSSLYDDANAELLSRQSLRTARTGFNILQPPPLLPLDQEWIKCCNVLRYLIGLTEESHLFSTPSPDLRTHFLVLEHRLLCLSVEGPLAACCRLGLVLYCNIALWNWPKASSLIQSLLHHLRQAVISCGPSLYEQSSSGILIWCFFFATSASANEETQDWYLQHLEDLLSRRGVTTLGQVRSLLRGCFYVDRLSENHLQSLKTKLNLVDDTSNLSAPTQSTMETPGRW